MYKVVNVRTQEEWDFVSKCLEYDWQIAKFTDRGTLSCINTTRLGTANYKYYWEKESTIYSFKEWCDLTNNYPENIRNDIVINQDLSYLSEFLTNLGIK